MMNKAGLCTVALMSAVFCSVGLAGSAHAETIPVKETRTSTVRIVPVDVLGDELEDVDVDLFQPRGDGTDFAKRFHRGIASKILYGTYTARIHVRGFRLANRLVRVYQPNVVVVVGLSVGGEGDEWTWDLSGLVRGGGRTAGPLWIRVSGVYSDIILDAEVSDSGGFSLEKMPGGPYVLALVQGGKVLDVRAIKVPLESPLMIEIGDSKPTSKSDGKVNP
jgi:hypothetical protein